MTAAMVVATNTARQPNGTISALPPSGARIGDTQNTSITSAISFVASGPVCRSRMMRARDHAHGGGAEALDKTERDQPRHARRQTRSRSAGDEQRQTRIERRLAAIDVGQRTISDLAQAESR